MDRLEAMSLLVTAVDAGSLSAAGRRLGMPLATVSRKISELEAQLHTQLLIRSSRQLAMTDAGRSYVAACRRILDQVRDAERSAAGEYSAPRGELIVTAPIVFGRLHVLPALTEFLAVYPAIDIRLVLSDRIVPLLADHIDLAVRIGELPDSSLRATRIGAVRRVVCGSPAYFGRHREPQEPAELAGHSCISFEPFDSASSWRFPRPDERGEQVVALRSRLSVNTAEAALDAAVCGLGVTRLLCYQTAQAEAAGTLRRVLQRFEPPPQPVNLVYADPGLLPRKLEVCLEFVAPRLRSRLGDSTCSQ